MSHEDNIYPKELHEQDLTELAELCAKVARNVSADSKQSDTAHALRMEWVDSVSMARWTAVAQNRKRPCEGA